LLNSKTLLRPAQHNIQAWKASISIRSYQEAALAVSVSGNTRPPHLTKEEIMNLTNRPIINNATSVQQSLTPLLCYACHTTLTSRGTTRGGIAAAAPGQFATPLPMWVHDHIIDHDDHRGIAFQTTKLTEKEMKAEIGEFLLPDE
jgi:cytoplasmic tRNA 2-thiolation protein 2